LPVILIIDATLAIVGGYSCTILSQDVILYGQPFCSLYVSVAGALILSSNTPITIQFTKVRATHASNGTCKPAHAF